MPPWSSQGCRWRQQVSGGTVGYALHLIGPGDVCTPEGGLYPFDLFERRYLAQGDS